MTLHPKVSSALLAGYLTTIILYGLHERWGIDPSVEVGSAITGILCFALGWLTPSPK